MFFNFMKFFNFMNFMIFDITPCIQYLLKYSDYNNVNSRVEMRQRKGILIYLNRICTRYGFVDSDNRFINSKYDCESSGKSD